MAVMLRTQGIASRVVNGFLPGSTTKPPAPSRCDRATRTPGWKFTFRRPTRWVTFDPPTGGTRAAREHWPGCQLAKYSEALELMWFQYVVGYDKQEQRSLITNFRRQLSEVQRGSIARLNQARAALPRAIRPNFCSASGLLPR